jgi:branched-chain amino acid transport system substrate-binding protein
VKKFIIPLVTAAMVVSIMFAGCVPGAAPTTPVTPPPVTPPPVTPPPVTPPPVTPPEEEWSWVVVDEWKIPSFNGVTGSGAYWGEVGTWVCDYTRDLINAAGGIAGKPLVLDPHDDGWDASKAAAEISKVVPWALTSLGPWTDVCDTGAMPIAVQASMFVFINQSGATIAEQYQPWCFHALDKDENIYPQAVKAWLKKNPDITKVALFYVPEHAMWVEISNIVAETCEEMGVEVGARVEIPEGTVDFGPPAVTALGSGADGFWFACDPIYNAKTVVELQDRGLTESRRVLIFPHGEDPSFWEVGQDRFEGMYIVRFLNSESTLPRYVAYVDAMTEAHGEGPYDIFASMVDQIYLLKAAIEDSKITGDPAKLAEERILIRDYCRNVTDFPFITGTASVVNGFEHNPVYLFQVENNKFVLVSRVDDEGNDIPLD